MQRTNRGQERIIGRPLMRTRTAPEAVAAKVLLDRNEPTTDESVVRRMAMWARFNERLERAALKSNY
ncbi:hypothetical protein KKB44_04630 [Candidatus Micrarchaeota archaeon]|nr:hypothetical protein [Candidatus Micrarchaeota archaeon]